MDCWVLLKKDLWYQLLNQYDLNESMLRDRRYDLVVHLNSPLDQSGHTYALDKETKYLRGEETIQAEQELIEAWISHSNFLQISQCKIEDFQVRFETAMRGIFNFLGLSPSQGLYKKYLIADPHKELLNLLEKKYSLKLHTSYIKDIIFFDNESHLVYYRKKRYRDHYSFIRCEKTQIGDSFVEKMRSVDYKEYISMLKMDSRNKHILKRKRSSFIFKGNLLCLDEMAVEDISFAVCWVTQIESQNSNLRLPKLLKINLIKEITCLLKRESEYVRRDHLEERGRLQQDQDQATGGHQAFHGTVQIYLII